MDELLANAESGTQLDRLMKNAIKHIPALTAEKEAIYGPSTVKKRVKPKTRYSRNIYHALDGGDTEDVKRHIKKLVAIGTLSEPWPFHDQFTPLHVAASHKDVTHFQLMIEAGADHTVLDTSGRDAIAYGRSVKWWGETPEEHEARVNRLCSVVADHEASKLAASLVQQSAQPTTTKRGRL